MSGQDASVSIAFMGRYAETPPDFRQKMALRDAMKKIQGPDIEKRLKELHAI